MKGLISFWQSDVQKIRKLLTRVQTDVERANVNPMIKKCIVEDFKTIVKALAKGKTRERQATPRHQGNSESSRTVESVN